MSARGGALPAAFGEAQQRRERATEVVGVVVGAAGALLALVLGVLRQELPDALSESVALNFPIFVPACLVICLYGLSAYRAVGTRWYDALSAGRVAIDVLIVMAAFVLMPPTIQPHMGMMLVLPVLAAGVRFGLAGSLWTWLSLMLVFAQYTYHRWHESPPLGAHESLIEPFLTALVSFAVAGLIGHQCSVTARQLRALEDAQRALAHQATHDALTGLANRTALQQRTPHLTGNGALLLIDLDGFKAVNDAHGHAVGDEILQNVAARLRARTNPGDLVVRLGGDEFVVLLLGVKPQEVADLAADLAARLEEPIPTRAGALRLEASIGTALAGTADECWDLDALSAEADAKMYAEKKSRQRVRKMSREASGNPFVLQQRQ